MALEMEYLLSSDEMQSQRSTVLPPIPSMSISAAVEPHDAGEGASPMVGLWTTHESDRKSMVYVFLLRCSCNVVKTCLSNNKPSPKSPLSKGGTKTKKHFFMGGLWHCFNHIIYSLIIVSIETE